MNILAVDHNTANLKTLVGCIKKVYPQDQVLYFSDPMLAAQYAFNNPVSLLFTEVTMPRLDGFLLAKMVRDRHPDIQVSFVTGTDKYRTEAALLQGKYILKPVTAEQIQNR